MNRRERRAQEKADRAKAEKGKGAAPAAPPVDKFDPAKTYQASVTALNANDLKTAEEGFRAILARHPDHPETLDLLGVVCARTGRMSEALGLMTHAVSRAPKDPGARNNLANVLSSLGRHPEAVAHYKVAAELSPNDAQVHNNLGSAFYRMGDFAAAEHSYLRAIGLRPGYAEALSNYGNVLIDKGDVQGAVEVNRKALAANANYPPAWNNLGNGLRRQGHYEEALDAYARAVRLRPLYADAVGNMAETLKEQGRAAEAVAFHRKALQIDPADAGIHSNLLFAMNALTGVDRKALLEESKRWAERFAGPGPGFGAIADPDPERVLKVGYVSADFRRHSVAYFIEPVVRAHDRRRVHVTCYADVAQPDTVTRRIRAVADSWRDVRGLSDARLADRVRADGIDLLVDLGGHTMGSRLRAFALRPAPLQATGIGYPGTTGMMQIDARITDWIADPAGAESAHTEKLVRIDGGFLAYLPPADAPGPAPVPSQANGHVTFGSFNNLAKVTADVVAVWARVLGGVPDSRLFLKAKALADSGTRARVLEQFAAHGIAADRIEFSGWVLEGSPLSAYAKVDVALDPFPYNGTTTTCEALWMGVPAVTLAGDTHAGRVGLDLLARVALGDLAAETVEGYVVAATGLAADGARRAALRTGLRAAMRDGGLLDGARVAAGIETAFRELWRERLKLPG